jgi:hypothetical protein
LLKTIPVSRNIERNWKIKKLLPKLNMKTRIPLQLCWLKA